MILRLAAASTALALLLTACGGSTGEPSANPTERPEYARQAGEAGAERFAGYWVEALNEASDTGDTEALRSLSATSCAACTDFANQLDTIYGADGRVESEGWQVGKVVPEAGATDDDVTLLVTFQVPPQKVYPSADAEPESYEGGEQAFRMTLTREDGDWTITNLTAR